jgi:hypothetical protein
MPGLTEAQGVSIRARHHILDGPSHSEDLAGPWSVDARIAADE